MFHHIDTPAGCQTIFSLIGCPDLIQLFFYISSFITIPSFTSNKQKSRTQYLRKILNHTQPPYRKYETTAAYALPDSKTRKPPGADGMRGRRAFEKIGRKS